MCKCSVQDLVIRGCQGQCNTALGSSDEVHEFNVGDAVVYSVYPHFADENGIVVDDDGIKKVMSHPNLARRLEDEGVSAVCDFDVVHDIRHSQDDQWKKEVDHIIQHTMMHRVLGQGKSSLIKEMFPEAVDIKMSDEKHVEFYKARCDFMIAASKLLHEWQKVEYMEEVGADGYPFEYSFEEMEARIRLWHLYGKD